MTSSIPPRVGRYEIVDRLGAGGMGVVYLATDPMLRREVAIKVLPAADDSELRERFLREARSVAALRHPNIVAIYDIGEEQGKLFIAMERVDGLSMAEAIRAGAPYPIERKLRLMLDLCASLGYAHKQGIIHRDVKPGNLMIAADGTLKVLDFGLARLVSAADSGLTQSGAVIGTPSYMSPEQVSGAPIDHRSDIFSVGLVLYEWLSLQRAFAGESIPTVLHDIVHKQPTPLRVLMPSLDPQLAAMVDRALQKDPARRYRSLDEMAGDLQRVLAGQPGAGPEASTVILDQRDTATVAPGVSPSARPSWRAARVAALVVATLSAGGLSAYVWYRPLATPAPPEIVQLESPVPAPANATPEPRLPAGSAVMAMDREVVSIDVLPWARVRIVPVGHTAPVPKEALLTPFSVELAPGAYRLECDNDGISPPSVFPITVEAGRPLSVSRAMPGFDPSRLVETLAGPRR